jgi:hypothetical protein
MIKRSIGPFLEGIAVPKKFDRVLSDVKSMERSRNKPLFVKPFKNTPVRKEQKTHTKRLALNINDKLSEIFTFDALPKQLRLEITDVTIDKGKCIVNYTQKHKDAASDVL